MMKKRSYRYWRSWLVAVVAMLAIAACGSGSGGGGGDDDDEGDGQRVQTVDCNGSETESTADTITVAVGEDDPVTIEEVLPDDFCITATYDVESDTNTIEVEGTASQPGLSISLDALGLGEYTFGDGIAAAAMVYSVQAQFPIVYTTITACPNDATVNLDSYSTRLTGDYAATLFSYNVMTHATDCDETVEVSGTFDVARSAFTYPESFGETECDVGADEICFVVVGDDAVTYESGVNGNAFSAVYNLPDTTTKIKTDMTDSATDLDLTLSFKHSANGTYNFAMETADVFQTRGGGAPPAGIDVIFLSNYDATLAEDCGTSEVKVTFAGDVGGRIIGRFVAELFTYNFAAHDVSCDLADRRVVYGAFNVKRGANTNIAPSP